MTVCSGLQGSENKTACKALKNQLQLTGFPVLEIKTEFPFGKLWEKGLITYFVFELPFSPKESIYFSLPLEDFFFHCFSLSSHWVETAGKQTAGILWLTGTQRQTLLPSPFPTQLQCRAYKQSHGRKDIMDFCTPDISLLLRSCILASFLLIFHITSLFKMFCNSQHYH